MLVTMDKRGSINLPMSVRKEVQAEPGSHFELVIEPGGNISLFPVEIYRSIRVNASGRQKIQEAKEAESAGLPDWFKEEIENAGAADK